MKNAYQIKDLEFHSRSAAARHYGLNPKMINESVTKFGWTLKQALEFSMPSGC
ncbi:hypothetical protein AB4589_12100 [Vibrio sp. 10N.222.49.A3]|uniref:hypothetical protein n=1 Tax=Vibrio sp. 10N.222.49.A3 TaxID=3229611 RepID=UPI00355367DB